MFLERNGKYKEYSQISKYLFIGTLVMMFFVFLSSFVFGGMFEHYLKLIGIVLFGSGVIVDIIPDFLEKDRQKIVLDTIFILFILLMLILLIVI